MIKKRKNKSSKFARMTDEERSSYMQYRAEFELETKRRKQQLIATFIKSKLKREEVFSRLNVAKINEKWRYVLRQIKCNEFYSDVKYLSETFERIMTLKDETIHRFHDELKIVDIDHKKCQEAHIVLLDDIVEKHKRRLHILHNTSNLEDIKTKSFIELNGLRQCMEQNCKEIQKSINERNKLLKEGRSTIKIQNAINIRNLLYLEEDTASNVVHETFATMENLWDELNTVLTDYKTTTEDKRKQNEYLNEQDNIHQVYLSEYPRVHSQLQNVLENFKHDIHTLSVKRGDRIEKHKAKVLNMQVKIKIKKHEFTINQVRDSLLLKKLTIASMKVLKNLQRTMEKGSVMLEIIKICSASEPLLCNLRKYFTEDATYDATFCTNISQSFDKIHKFWEQYNHIKAANILLKKGSDKLCLENKMLRLKLQAYLVTVSGVPKWRLVASTSGAV